MTRFIFFSILIHIALAVVFIVFSDKSILDRLSSLSVSENPQEIQEESNQANQKSSLTPTNSQKPVNSVKKISKNIKKTKKKVKKTINPVAQKDSRKTLQKNKNISKKNSKSEKPALANPLESQQPILAHQKEEDSAPIKRSAPEETVSPQTTKNDKKQNDLSLNDSKEEQTSVSYLTETQKVFDELEQEKEISEFSDVLNKMDGDQSLSPEDLAQLANPDNAYKTPPDDEDIPLIPRETEKQLIQAEQNSSALVPDSKEIKSYKTLRQAPGNPKPIYPNQARQNNQQGSVLLMYFVDESGLVDKMQLLKSSGHSLLDNEALRVLSRQQYLPGQSGWYKHRVDFRLKQTEDTSFSLSSG